MIQAGYKKRIAELTETIDTLRSKDTSLALMRFVFGFLGLALFFVALYQWSFLFLILSVVSFGVFVLFVKQHQRVRSNRRFQEHLKLINQEEESYLQGNLSSLPDGAAHRDVNHMFSGDLDLFGKGSLFQRINRSRNEFGQGILAGRMRSDRLGDLGGKQATIRSLHTQLDWRQSFQAIAMDFSERDLEVIHTNLTSDSTKSRPKWFSKPVLWLLSLWFPTLIVLTVWLWGGTYADQLIYPFLINVVVFFYVLRSFKKDQDILDQMSKDFEVYARLIEQIELLEHNSNALEQRHAQLTVEDRKASSILHELAEILSRMDSANNAFGAALINGFIFYHLHVLLRLIHWKELYASKLQVWVKLVHEMEADLSLANYAYNHPDFTFPIEAEGAETNTYQAVGLGHPFIEEGNRVSNDLDYNAFKAVVLTGSNMAGKSTFLRSIGLSLVMSGLGLPVCASSLKLSQFTLLTSMKPQDDVNENTSYFQAEVNRLRVIMDRVEEGLPCFLLLDEILRGTNSEDKRNGTRAFLQKLIDHNMRTVLATHDVDMADLAKNDQRFKNFFFESGYNGKDLTFDYLLREGVCASPNATQLLKLKKLI